jgi:hypothetical protein
VESTPSCGIEGDECASKRCQGVEYAVPDSQILQTPEVPSHWTSPWEIEDDESVSIFLEEVGYAVPDQWSLRMLPGEQSLLIVVSNKSILAT